MPAVNTPGNEGTDTSGRKPSLVAECWPHLPKIAGHTERRTTTKRGQSFWEVIERFGLHADNRGGSAEALSAISQAKDASASAGFRAGGVGVG